MAILVRIGLILALGLPLRAFASGEDLEPDEHVLNVRAQEKFLCHSTTEFIQTLKFLRETKVIILPESTARLVAEKVSRACDGAAGRFSQVLTSLKGIGLSDHGALALSLDFASRSPDVQKNFTEIFTRAFLSEFFDYDYVTAMKIALELSRDYKGEPAQVREDFIELVRFCKDGKTLDLPAKTCAEYVLKLANLSQYYPEGVRQPFYKLYKDLRENHDFGLDMKTSLEICYNVLKNGPRAPENFYSGFEYAKRKEGLDLTLKPALAFAIKMADRSFIGGETPPPIAPVKPPEADHDVAAP